MIFQAIHLYMTVDHCDPHRSATMEHFARRLLQIQKAVKRSPKVPDFEGLELYMNHLLDPSGAAHAPSFDAHIASVTKDEMVVLKQMRLAKEEALAKKKKGKGGGKGGEAEQ